MVEREMADERYRVQSVDKALTILDALGASGPEGMTGSEVAKHLGSSKSTAFALLQTLLERGFVADSGQGPTRRYRLGMALARLGERVVSQITLRDVAMPILHDVTDATGLTSRLAVLEDAWAVVLGRVDAPGTVRFTSNVGRRELPHSSGVGKALLAALPPERVRELVERTGLPQRTPKTITEADALLRDLDAVRERGYAIDDEEDAEGVFCVGASFADHQGEVAGGISVTGLKLDLPAWRIHQIGETVHAHADRISAALGAPADR
ncbi:MAG: IclR family transcriptional regulator, acetate operon repressor [Solirubrobacteraceae bacterium]|nr:IclR family transcriptional regulator, acetate operon repressor [Solirubrobacteraceae bacterium]